MVYAHSSTGLYWQRAIAEEPHVEGDETLVRSLKKGDPEAWAKLYEDYLPRIYRYICLRVRDRAEAEDLTGQVFLKALEAGPSFRWRGAPVSSWLFRIARNQVIDYWRTDKSRRMVPLNESLVDEFVDPEGMAEMNADIRRVMEEIGRLTDAQREVIELRFGGELSTAEVATVLGKSKGAVKVMQHSALAALRRRLADRSCHE
jgi:RNA polymerase sigma-70 factor (ECF subfamily)